MKTLAYLSGGLLGDFEVFCIACIIIWGRLRRSTMDGSGHSTTRENRPDRVGMYSSRYLGVQIVRAACMRTLLLSAVLLVGCSNMTPQQKAATQTLVNIAQIAVDGVATHYGGAEAGVLASAAFSSAATVAQGYIGTTIPADVLRASPGVAGVGTALDKIIEPNHVVSQAAVDQAHKIAAIATTLKPALVSP